MDAATTTPRLQERRDGGVLMQRMVRRPSKTEVEEMAKELLWSVMPKMPWNHNTVILQSIYRQLAKYVLKNFERRTPNND